MGWNIGLAMERQRASFCAPGWGARPGGPMFLFSEAFSLEKLE
jgi:hypothetical protein